MNSKIGVLVFPAGEINSVELRDALSTCVNIRLIGASSVDRHGEYVFRNYISGIPKITESNFIQKFNELIEKEKVNVVIPTHDDVALFLAENKDKIKANLLTPDVQTALICRDKKRTYELFQKYDFCPQTYSKPEIFPVFMKPRKGQGSVGARLIESPCDMPQETDWKEYVICEYLPGEEITVDCFTDKNGELRYLMPRTRERIWGGVSVHASKEKLTDEIFEIAEAINRNLAFSGLWYFQLKKDKSEKWKLLEISTRCAGTMCLSRATGVNLPLLSIYTCLGYDVEVFDNDYQIQVDRALISRYKTSIEYECVYIDLDDTILVQGRVHLPAIWFLYQCINEKKEIVLLTRHASDHEDTVEDVLKKHRISLELFDKIIELDFNTPKYKVMNNNKAIFIDNAYAERKLVHDKLGIPVFDVDGIEILMDWRQ